MVERIWNKRTAKTVEQDRHNLFESTVLPYLNSGYNLARWLTRSEQDAEDAVQEASLRAWRSFDTFLAGRDARAWFLTIVRNTCRTLHRKNRPSETDIPLEDDSEVVGTWPDPEEVLIKKAKLQLVHEALAQLPFEYREVVILRELEELSYKEIAKIIDIPMGTVMSRLSRARRELYARLCAASEGVGQ
jgi:RNA polymerase sigma-70 factor, ECF subfamily